MDEIVYSSKSVYRLDELVALFSWNLHYQAKMLAKDDGRTLVEVPDMENAYIMLCPKGPRTMEKQR